MFIWSDQDRSRRTPEIIRPASGALRSRFDRLKSFLGSNNNHSPYRGNLIPGIDVRDMSLLGRWVSGEFPTPSERKAASADHPVRPVTPAPLVQVAELVPLQPDHAAMPPLQPNESGQPISVVPPSLTQK